MRYAINANPNLMEPTITQNGALYFALRKYLLTAEDTTNSMRRAAGCERSSDYERPRY